MMAAMRDTLPVELFLEGYPEPMRDVAASLRGIVRSAVPESIEAVKPGWRVVGYDVPVGRRTAFYAWIGLEPIHVHLGFHWGALMDDPDGLLEGRGVTKRVRWLTFLPGDLLDPDLLGAMLIDARRVATLSPPERFARTIDRDEDRSLPFGLVG
jgi:hypothetical protein